VALQCTIFFIYAEPVPSLFYYPSITVNPSSVYRAFGGSKTRMAPLRIMLQGTSSITCQAERGDLSFIVKARGTSQDSVSNEVTEASNQVNQLFEELSPRTETGEIISGSPVTSFSSTMIHTGSEKPLHLSGNPQPTGYSASLVLNAVFQDFNKLNEIVGKLISYPNIEIKCLNWRLTEATKKSLSSVSRQEAMRDAVQKANDYASIIGQEVVAVSISEVGGGTHLEYSPWQYNTRYQNPIPTQQMTQAHILPQSSAEPMYQCTDLPLHPNPDSDASDALNLSPQLIRYTNSVQVVFEAVTGRGDAS
jgi:uncharacterized protein YggE